MKFLEGKIFIHSMTLTGVKMALPNLRNCAGFIIFYLLLAVSCERVREKMYENINGAFCFKRLNATHEFGCTSSRSGNTGVLHIVKTNTDLTWFLQEAKADPYVVMLPFDFPDFAETLRELKNSGKVSGLIITSNRTSYSPDDVCPNRYSGLQDGQCDNGVNEWNKVGSSLLFENFGFPIMYIDTEEYPKDVEFLNKCFEKYNAHDLEHQTSRSLCALELTSHMLAAVDSRTCIRRSTMINNLTPMRYCDPLLGLNIHLPIYPRYANSEVKGKDKSVILVVTRLDGTSMFDGLVPGAASPIIGIVSLLTVAHVLKTLTEKQQAPERNVMFVFFDGEAHDYIGSSRMVYDMENDAFPSRLQPDVEKQSKLLKMEDIGLIVELDQVLKNNIFYHSIDKITDNDGMAAEFIRALKDELKKLSMKLDGVTGRLPPASLQRFLMKDPSIKGVVLSSYNSSFDNQFYHSVLDTGKNLNFTYQKKTEFENNSIQKYLADFSLAVGKSLYKVLFKSEPSNGKSDSEIVSLVNELLYCYLESPSCEIFENVTFRKPLDKKPYSVYVGVTRNSNLTTLTGLTLAWLTGTEVSRDRSACHSTDDDLVHQYFWMVGESGEGACIESCMNYSLAQSPAFDITDYDWTSHKYSTWTESVWQEKLSARAFIKPSKKHEILTLSVGLTVFILSFIIVYFVSTKASILFNQQILESGNC